MQRKFKSVHQLLFYASKSNRDGSSGTFNIVFDGSTSPISKVDCTHKRWKGERKGGSGTRSKEDKERVRLLEKA